MQEKERGCAAVEAYMIQTEDKTDVKKYLNLLDKLGRDAEKSAAVNTFHEIDRARYYLGMVFGEPGCIRERIGNLKDGTGKGYAVLALAAAQEKLDAAREGKGLPMWMFWLRKAQGIPWHGSRAGETARLTSRSRSLQWKRS